MRNVLRKCFVVFFVVLRVVLRAKAGALEEWLGVLKKKLEDDPGGFRVYWKNGLRFDSRDHRFKYRLGGSIQNDRAFFDADPALEDAFGLQEEGVEVRRAQIFIWPALQPGAVQGAV